MRAFVAHVPVAPQLSGRGFGPRVGVATSPRKSFAYLGAYIRFRLDMALRDVLLCIRKSVKCDVSCEKKIYYTQHIAQSTSDSCSHCEELLHCGKNTKMLSTL